MDVEPAAIVDCRMVKKGNHSVPQVLIRWTHLPQEATTWEDYLAVKQRFPKALTWDKQVLKPGRCYNRWLCQEDDDAGEH
jgi:hypothetical protein